MADFDDLLSSSNPFDDPFSKPRLSSPDPWANPYAIRQSEDSNGPGTGLSDRPASSPSPPSEPEQEPLHSNGPLDLSAIESLETELPTSTSGFREFSVSAPADNGKGVDIHTGQTSARAPSPTTPTGVTSYLPATPKPPSVSSTPSEPNITPTSHSTELVSSVDQSAPWQPEPSFVSPLDRQQPTLTHSFSNLALGGSSDGWGPTAADTFTNEREPSVSSTAAWHSRQSTDEEDDDDKPLQAIVDKSRANAEAKHNGITPSTSDEQDGSNATFSITVDDPQKVGDPIRGYTMYTVHTRTTSILFRSPSFSVLRRYSDFLWLYETLSLNNPGVVVPPVPEKSPFGRFEDSFVEQRRLGLEKCINKMANHPVLMKDTDLKMFLESDSFALDIKQRKAEIANERGGLMTSIGQTISGPRFHETDEWFDQKKSYLDSLEQQLRGLVKAIDLVTKQRAELAAAIGEFGQTISELSGSDLGKPLAHALAGLAEVERKAQAIQNAQSRQDVMTIMNTADEYARLISSVRLAFSSRVRTYHAWQNADAEVRRVKQLHERNRAQGRIQADRIGYSMNQIAEAERRAMDTKQEFEQCSRLIKSEVARFEQERITDFKVSLQQFLDGMVDGQKQLISAWESYQQTLLKGVNRQGQIQAEEQADGS